MITQKHKDLQSMSTFGLQAHSRYLLEFDNDADLAQVSEFVIKQRLPSLALGGGSNMIFCADYPGVVIQNKSNTIERLTDTLVRVDAGCALDDFVKWSIVSQLSGIEALSGIPGTVGGGVALNAGAYGQVIKDTLYQVQIYDVLSKKLLIFKAIDLHLNHRSSIIREIRGNGWVILNATFKLDSSFSVPSHPKVTALNASEKSDPLTLRNSILGLRSHIPDPRLYKNSGSFFLNPILTNKEASQMQIRYPDISMRPHDANHMQLAAGWLLDTAGLKGQKYSGFYIHKNHANIVINESSQATGQDLFDFVNYVREAIYDKFALHIKVEPLLIGEEYWQDISL